jgi:predicted Zn-dependent peptidase
MTRLAKNEIYFNTYQTVESILKGIDEVNEGTLKTLASHIFDEQYFCLTVLGPMDGSHLANNPRPWSQWNR